MKILDALELFIIDRELKGNSEKTLDNYRQQINYFIDYVGNIDTEEITLKNLRDFQFHISNKEKYDDHPFKINKQGKLSKVTIQTYLRQLRVFIKYLYEEEIIENDLTIKFKLPKAPKKVIDILNDDEKERILNYYSEKSELKLRNKCIIALMLDCGLRRTEVINLEYPNINYLNNYIKVSGKGDKERLVPIGLTTKKLLKKYSNMRSLPEFQTKKLFIDKNRKPMTDNALKQVFSRLKKNTQIDRLHPHMLRHTFATDYLVNGGDIYSLQAILGHTSLEMVRKYLHLASSYIIANHKRLSPLDEHQRQKYRY